MFSIIGFRSMNILIKIDDLHHHNCHPFSLHYQSEFLVSSHPRPTNRRCMALSGVYLQLRVLLWYFHFHFKIFSYGVESGGRILRSSSELVEATFNITPTSVHHLGFTDLPRNEFEKFLTAMAIYFTPGTYDLIYWNCNTFTELCARMLLDRGIPRYILDVPESVMSTLSGPLIISLFRSVHRLLNPFNRTCDALNNRTLDVPTLDALLRGYMEKCLARLGRNHSEWPSWFAYREERLTLRISNRSIERSFGPSQCLQSGQQIQPDC